ncbi:MAG: hypothetical protein Fur0037_25420 [Planctomycetota bacterium]
MIHRIPLSFAGLLFALSVPAQKTLNAKSFVPEGYRGEVFADFRALDQREMIQGLERTMLGALFALVEEEMGFRFEDLDSVHIFPGLPDEEGHETRTISIFEGNQNVGLPAAEKMPGYREERRGDARILIEQDPWLGGPSTIYASPRDGLLVIGQKDAILPKLDGKAAPVMPRPNFLSLTSGRNVLAYVVLQLTPAMLDDIPGLDGEYWSREDPPRFLMVRMRAEPPRDAEGEKDERIVLEAVVRCDGKDGPIAIARAAEKGIEAAAKHRKLGALKRLWGKIEVTTDGIDCRARMPLGTPRQAAGALALMIAPVVFLSESRVVGPLPAAQLEAVEVEPPADPEGGEEKPEGEKNGGGQQKGSEKKGG